MAEVSVHTDKAEFVSDCVIIHARHEMTDWSVREFCRRPVLFRERRYYVRETGAAEKPFARTYLLAPWPQDLQDASPHTVYYDEDYVRRRDRQTGGESMEELIHFVLFCVMPIVGFLWSGTKKRFEKFGINSHTATSLSVFLTYSAALFAAILVGWLGQPSRLNYSLLLLLLLDVCCRYSQLHKDVESPWGFGEWVHTGLKRLLGIK